MRSHARVQTRLVLHLLRWIALGAASGLLAGAASFVFLEVLDRATEVRLDHAWLLYLLPAAGLVVGAAYLYLGGRSSGGNSMLIEEIHEPTAWVPRRLAPLVLVGTVISHLFGASVGREGTAIQMSGSLTDLFSRVVRLGPADRRMMLIASIAGGFGSVFGVPLAGAVFALEVQTVGRVRYDALVPALTASIVGDLTVRGLGHVHAVRPQLTIDLTVPLVLEVAAAGLAFGLASVAFIELTHSIKRLASRLRWSPARPVIGGVATIALAMLFGRDYLGLSLPLIDNALAGASVSLAVPLLKIVFTALALGCGFPGGEVTPLFVIGATLGAALAGMFGVPVTVLAAVGFVAVFAGAANTPLACTIMGVELFGSGIIVPLAVGCVVAYVFSSHRGIYDTQRVDSAKGPDAIAGLPRLRDLPHPTQQGAHQ
ncbi:MAG: chloride channel protein [Acidimicrobiales bacterium]